MSAIDIMQRLNSQFARDLKRTMDQAEDSGLKLLLYCGYRSLEEQARLWRKSRNAVQIVQKCKDLSSLGFPELAEVIDRVGPQRGVIGRHVTMAGPGESFHNYGLAADLVILQDGKPDWDVSNPDAWLTWGRFVVRNCLFWGGSWTHFQELPHVQAGPGGNPLKDSARSDILSLLDAARAVG
jgi:hypothetical protein